MVFQLSIGWNIIQGRESTSVSTREKKVVVRVTLFKENLLKTSEIIQIGKKDTPGIIILLQSDRLNIKMWSKILSSFFFFQKDGLWSSGIGKALLKFICIKPPSNATISLVGTGFGTDLTSGDIIGEIVDSVTNAGSLMTTSVATDVQIAGKI